MKNARLTTEPRVLICEPEYELRNVYMRHFERSHVPVHGIGDYQELFAIAPHNNPNVIMVSIYGTVDGVAQFLQRVAKSYQGASVVVLTRNQHMPIEHLLGTTVTKHFEKQYTSPKDLVSSITKLLSFSH